MQKGSANNTVQDSVSKPIPLGLITALVIGVVAPIIMPHITHPSMIYHVTLHIASLTIAVFLSIVSVLAYSRNASTRLLFMSFGFIALGTVELLYLLDSTALVSVFNISALNIELPHVLMLAMLVMFGLGVLKVNR